ncbi:APC family permease [Natronorubrum aibiense]|uniref:Amino acid permease n=1 Tax=Natronorubrum aibiense TaxID=348826 RepID=A0A5P9P377_9EURY|nr:APC family permease [Natronorubrum aibiense]QFU82516.1 amino acid permease [Natronorubrum aibiense]
MSTGNSKSDRSLSRDVGPFAAIATVVAGTLGAGLFVTLGTASSTTGPSVILIIALSGLIAMSIAVNYSWLATIFPAAGSTYSYVSRAFRNRLGGFVATWSLWLGYMAAVAVLAIGFGSYLQVFYAGIDPRLAGAGLIALLFLVNMLGIRRYSVSQNAIFILLVVSILVLVVPGSFTIEPANYTPFFTGGFDGALAAAVPLFYAYIGIAVAGEIGAEVKNPSRNLPLAMIGGTLILVTLYMWTAAVIYGVVGDYTVLANSDRPLATAAETFLPLNATAVVAFGGLLATASSVHAVMAAGIKLPYCWGWDEVFPARFSEVNERWQTPHWSLFTLFAVSIGLTFWTSGLDQVIAISTFSYLIAYGAASLTAMYVFVAKPTLRSKAAFDPGALLFVPGVIGLGGCLVLLSQAYQGSLSIFVPWLAIGLAVFGVYWYLGQQSGTDVDAILDTLPGVPTDEYDPNIRGDLESTDDSTTPDGHEPADD